MSDDYTTLSLVTLAQEYRSDVVRQINRKTAFLKMVRIVEGGGKNIGWAPEGGGGIAETYADGVDPGNFAQDIQTAAYLPWGLYRSTAHVSSLALDAASTSSTPEGNRALWGRTIVNSAAALAVLINQDCFAGTGSGTTMTGLGVAVSDADYATVDRTSSNYEFFASTVIDPGTDLGLTLALIRDDIRKVYEASGTAPDMAVCSPAVFNKVGNLFDATRRQMDNVMSPRGLIRLDAGFQALEVDGTVFFKDKDCTAKTVYYLNSDEVELQYLPSASQQAMLEATGASISADDGFGAVPLGMKYEMLAKTGPSEKAEILWTGNLVVKRPNACAKRVHVLDS